MVANVMDADGLPLEVHEVPFLAASVCALTIATVFDCLTCSTPDLWRWPHQLRLLLHGCMHLLCLQVKVPAWKHAMLKRLGLEGQKVCGATFANAHSCCC